MLLLALNIIMSSLFALKRSSISIYVMMCAVHLLSVWWHTIIPAESVIVINSFISKQMCFYRWVFLFTEMNKFPFDIQSEEWIFFQLICAVNSISDVSFVVSLNVSRLIHHSCSVFCVVKTNVSIQFRWIYIFPLRSHISYLVWSARYLRIVTTAGGQLNRSAAAHKFREQA